MAIAPLGRFVHERGRVLVHVSARVRCASRSIPIAIATAIEGQMKARFRGSRVDRHGLSVCTSHVPKPCATFEQTRLFKVLFWSFVGSRGFCAGFVLVLISRGLYGRRGRRAFGPGQIGGFPRLARLLIRRRNQAQYRFLEAVGVSGRLHAEIWATGKICS